MLNKQSWKDQVICITSRHFLLQDCCNLMQRARVRGESLATALAAQAGYRCFDCIILSRERENDFAQDDKGWGRSQDVVRHWEQ